MERAGNGAVGQTLVSERWEIWASEQVSGFVGTAVNVRLMIGHPVQGREAATMLEVSPAGATCSVWQLPQIR